MSSPHPRLYVGPPRQTAPSRRDHVNMVEANPAALAELRVTVRNLTDAFTEGARVMAADPPAILDERSRAIVAQAVRS